MGCFCFLKSTKKTPPKPNTCNSHTKLQSTTTHRSPPLTLPFLDEEKEDVKEILSETPIINNSPIIHSTDENNNIPKKFSAETKQCHNMHDSVFKIAKIFNPENELSHEDIYKKINRSTLVGSDPKATIKELSRSIRVGSDPKETVKELSRSIRVRSETKETAKDRVGSDPKEGSKEFRSIRVGSDPKEMIKDVRTELRQKSPAKQRNTSPARRPEQIRGSGKTRNTSPAKSVDQLFGSGQNPNISSGRVGSGRNTGGLSRKDNGESSCRRSPVLCGDLVNGGTRNSINRCPSARKSGKSPGRVRSELGDRHRSPVDAGNGSRSNRENRVNNNSKGHLRSGINESIENPLVSMECFIFI
ncbi:hypothetical protein K7X08_020040 [Anisodus acutangulus]|uniref:Uncharacterized protein n=1 Tax=Anisodus acutangulus TaxID=402998 RepID=A0A9Q1MSS2_9SOLA|nr:hypothetical protein K7X08_020040 [Anisodus acutangulus]